MNESRTVFRQSLPVLITSLVNKSGSIGLNLLPMLLVEGHYTTGQSSLAMSFVKGTTIVATLVSGWLSDTAGLRPTLLGSFVLAGVGLAFLPVKLGFVALLIAGVVAQFGITSVNGTQRLLLTRTVERRYQKESLGWMRFVNNLGQILSYGLGSLSAVLGAQILIWFDSLTSFLAFGVGAKILPAPSLHSEESKTPPKLSKAKTWGPFIGCTLIIMGWNFMYGFFMDSVAGKLKVIYPAEGIRIFSLMMMLNTALCAALAVVATRFFNRVVPSLLLGVVLTVAGLILVLYSFHSYPMLFCSIFCLTLGEVVYGALGQFLLIRSVPPSQRENTIYSSALLIANLGRMVAAALAFPMVVYSDNPRPAMFMTVGVGVASALILLVWMGSFSELGEDSRVIVKKS